jgi:uncharacterized protein (TIGR00369 family)
MDYPTDELQKFYTSKHTFWEHVGLKIVELDTDHCTIALDLEPQHLNLSGILHGGVHATMIDCASGILAMTVRPDNQVVTTNLNVNYIAPITTGHITASARIITQTRSTMINEVNVYAPDGKILAFGLGTFRVLAAQGPVPKELNKQD